MRRARPAVLAAALAAATACAGAASTAAAQPKRFLDVRPDTSRVLERGGAPLSRPSAGDPADIAMRYVRGHLAELGLQESDLGSLQLEPRVRGAAGNVAVRFTQFTDGIPAYDSALEVIVGRDGSVVRVAGAPQHDLDVGSRVPTLTAPDAMRRLRENVGASGSPKVVSGPAGVTREHEFASGDTAELVAFGDRLAWKLSTHGPDHAWYAAVVDADTGAILYRANRTRSADEASVWEQYPGAPNGGVAATRSLTPYLNPGAGNLSGPYARLWSDLNDNDAVNTGEEVQRLGDGTFTYPFDEFTAAENPNGGCASTHKCSWDFETANSWTNNRAQNGVQTFYFVNRYRDHLVAAPIAFSAADGNFEGADRVFVNTDDGADGPGHRPDVNHADNAFMSTPPNGQPPLMGMFLFGNSLDFREVNGGDDAAIVYHEYTHGLSSRLITNGSGEQALDEEQAGAMGEGWSDWYAKDFLVDQFPADDTSAPGDVDMGVYVDNTPHSIRTQGLDCPVDVDDPNCPGSPTQGAGGYTYGDFNTVPINPDTAVHEVHQGGEIWAETLWDVRAAVGSQVAERIITEGMRNFTPPQPSMLDARDGIIAADRTIFGAGAHTAALWEAFANRGMGVNAKAGVNPDPIPDVVTEDFTRPAVTPTPTPSPTPTPTPTPTPEPVNPKAPVIRLPETGSRGRVRFTVICDSSCRGTARLTLSRTLARKLGLKKRSLVVRTVSLSRAATKRYTLKLSRKVTLGMKRKSILRLKTTLRVTVSDAERQSALATSTPRIRR